MSADRSPDRPPDRSRWGGRLLGLVAALGMVALGGLWTAQSFGLLGVEDPPAFLDVVGPAVAGLGVALGWVVLTSGRR